LLLHRPYLHLILSADNKVFLILDKPLGCSDSFFEIFQLPLQKIKSLGACRGISLGIQSRIPIINQSALFGDIGFQGVLLATYFDPTMSFFHFGPEEGKMFGRLELDL
jgi:hypothetical protein